MLHQFSILLYIVLTATSCTSEFVVLELRMLNEPQQHSYFLLFVQFKSSLFHLPHVATIWSQMWKARPSENNKVTKLISDCEIFTKPMGVLALLCPHVLKPSHSSPHPQNNFWNCPVTVLAISHNSEHFLIFSNTFSLSQSYLDIFQPKFLAFQTILNTLYFFQI